MQVTTGIDWRLTIIVWDSTRDLHIVSFNILRLSENICLSILSSICLLWCASIVRVRELNLKIKVFGLFFMVSRFISPEMEVALEKWRTVQDLSVVRYDTTPPHPYPPIQHHIAIIRNHIPASVSGSYHGHRDDFLDQSSKSFYRYTTCEIGDCTRGRPALEQDYLFLRCCAHR